MMELINKAGLWIIVYKGQIISMGASPQSAADNISCILEQRAKNELLQ